jgi:MoaA/NifB/PqqE/SkfB family radical SAM enzyme
VCCEIKKNKTFNLNNIEVISWWKSNYLKKLRKKFLENKRPVECSACWNVEDTGKISHRIESNRQYGTFFQNRFEKNLKRLKKWNLEDPEDVEINLSNLCNLKCQMCSGRSSSKLLVENNALNFENLKQKNFNITKKIATSVQKLLKKNINFLNLRGGEPFINKDILKILYALVKEKKSNDIELHITTNGTICNNNIIELLKKFKKVTIVFSIESVGLQNDYMRYPSRWMNIEKNINEYSKLKNVYLYINCVIQNLNLFYVDSLIDFAFEKKIHLKFYTLQNPEHLYYLNLPKNFLEECLTKLKKIPFDKLIHTTNVKETLIELENNYNKYVFNEKLFKNFCEMIQKRDNFRKISIKDYMPEFYKIL